MIKKYFIEYIEDDLELDLQKMSNKELKEEIEIWEEDLKEEENTENDIKAIKQIIKDCKEELRRRE